MVGTILKQKESVTFICGGCTREFAVILEPDNTLPFQPAEIKMCPFCGSEDLRPPYSPAQEEKR